jgi:hypothetical protein
MTTTKQAQKLRVSGCRGNHDLPACPFASERGCQHPTLDIPVRQKDSINNYLVGWDVDAEREAPPFPDWCPLREQKLVIELIIADVDLGNKSP